MSSNIRSSFCWYVATQKGCISWKLSIFCILAWLFLWWSGWILVGFFSASWKRIQLPGKKKCGSKLQRIRIFYRIRLILKLRKCGYEAMRLILIHCYFFIFFIYVLQQLYRIKNAVTYQSVGDHFFRHIHFRSVLRFDKLRGLKFDTNVELSISKLV